MSPNFFAGDFVLAFKHRWQKFNVGDVVLIEHQDYGKMIKRIASVENQTEFMLKSDNLQGVSTEKIGIITKNQVIGKVIYQIKSSENNG